MLKSRTIISRWMFAVLGLGLGASTGAAAEARDPAACAAVVPIAAGETWRGPGGSVGEARCFRVRAGEPGLFTLDLSSPEEPTTGLRLEVSAAGFAVVRGAAGNLTVELAAAGTVDVRVATQDPLLALPPFKLRAAFLAARRLAARDEDDDEMEIEPDPLHSRDEDDDEMEIEPDPRAYGLSQLPAAWAAELCRRGEVDDHGDTFACATPIRGELAAAGEIEGSWGDDEDVFRFRLTAPRILEIVSEGPTATVGELLDRFGHRLGLGDGGARGGGFRLVRALAPGTYFVRISGAGAAAGPYVLRVQPVD